MLDISRGHPMLNIGTRGREARSLLRTLFSVNTDLDDLVTVASRASIPLSERSRGPLVELPYISEEERQIWFAVCNNDHCDCCGRHLNRITRSLRAPCLCDICNKDLERSCHSTANCSLTNLPRAQRPNIDNLLHPVNVLHTVITFTWEERGRFRNTTKSLLRIKWKNNLLKFINNIEDSVVQWLLQYKYRKGGIQWLLRELPYMMKSFVHA